MTDLGVHQPPCPSGRGVSSLGWNCPTDVPQNGETSKEKKMNAKYNGHCKFETETKCGGIRKGQPITHLGSGNTFHIACENRTPEENDRANFEGAFYNRGYIEWAMGEQLTDNQIMNGV